MTSTGVLKPFAEGVDRILTPLSDPAGEAILDRSAPVTVIVLDAGDKDASMALAFLLPVNDLAKFLSLARGENVSELPGGVYRVGPPGGDALFCARVSATHIVLAYSETECARLAAFRESGEPSLADVLDEDERAMLSDADAAGFLRGDRAESLLGRFAPDVADLLATPAALKGPGSGGARLDWLRSIDRLVWAVKAVRTEGPPVRIDLAFDVRLIPAEQSPLAALIAKWKPRDARPADIEGTAAVVTWDVPLTPKLLGDFQQSLRSVYDEVRPIEALLPIGVVREPGPPSADAEADGLIAAFNRGLKPGHRPASQPAASRPAVAAPLPAEKPAVSHEILAARRERDLFLRDTFLLTESVTGTGGVALVPGTAQPHIGLVAWQRVRPSGDLDVSRIIAEWVDIFAERVRRDGVELPVTFEPDAGSVAEMKAARLGVGPVSALFLPGDDLFFLAGNLGDDVAAGLLQSFKEPTVSANDPPAQVRLSASLYNVALLATAGGLSKEDLDMMDRLAGVHGVRAAGVSGALRCTDTGAHIALRLRLEDLLLALQVLARAQQAP